LNINNTEIILVDHSRKLKYNFTDNYFMKIEVRLSRICDKTWWTA